MIKMYRTSHEGISYEVEPVNIEEIFTTLKEWRGNYEDHDDDTIAITIYRNRSLIYSWQSPTRYTPLPKHTKFEMYRALENGYTTVTPENVEDMFQVLERWQEDPKTKGIEIVKSDGISVYRWARG